MKKLSLRRCRLLALLAAAWQWPPRLTGSEWANANRILPAADAEPGPYRTDRFPLIREVQDVLADDDTREVVIWGPTQTAKTTAITNFIGRCIHYDPGRMLIVYPTEDKAAEFSTEKLEPMLVTCPALAERAAVGTARTHRKSVLTKTFPGMTIFIRGGNSPNAFSSGSIRYAIADELDRIPPSKEGRPLDLLRQRVTTFVSNYKLVMASTCTLDGESEIQREYLRSDQRKPYVACLACGHRHVMGFHLPGEHNPDGADGWIDFGGEREPEAARLKARYICPKCQHAHTDLDKPALLAGAEWRMHNPSSPAAGFWWSALYSPWVSFGQLAAEFRQARMDDDAMMAFVNLRLAETWKVKTDAVGDEALLACIDSDRPAGTVPPEAVLLTGGADVQKHVVYWVVRAWAGNGCSWLVSHGHFDREGDDLAVLDEAFAVTWGGKPVVQALMDSGWDEEVVYDHCIRRRNCAPSKGIPKDVDYVIKESVQDRKRGQYLGRRFSLWLVNSHRIRGFIQDRMRIAAGKPRAFRLHADVRDDPDYLRHMSAWARQEKHIRGRASLEWVELHRGDDHLQDAEIYAFAASRMSRVAAALQASLIPVAIPRPRTAMDAMEPDRHKGWVGSRSGWLRK